MSRLTLHGLLVSLIPGVGLTLAASASLASAQTLQLATGTRVEMALTRPLWARTAKGGDVLYGQTVFPVMVGAQIAVPAGTYVQALLESVTRPTRRSGQAQLRVEFTKMIFADGYTLVLNTATSAPISDVTVNVSVENDLLLDNGAQIEMTLPAAIPLDAKEVLSAIPLSRVPAPGSFRTATLCRFIPGSPGSTGTPGTPGTPPTVIPNGPDAPPTIIAGTPATPGTPGTPDTPAYYCPAAPMVVSSVAEMAGSPPATSKSSVPAKMTTK